MAVEPNLTLMQMIKPLKIGKKPVAANLLARPTKPNPTRIEATPLQEAVALEAYYAYVQQGRPEGCDVQHWLEAEAPVLSI